MSFYSKMIFRCCNIIIPHPCRTATYIEKKIIISTLIEIPYTFNCEKCNNR